MPLSPNLLHYPSLGSITIVGSRMQPYGLANVYLTTASTVFAFALLFVIFCAVHLALLLGFRFIKRTRQAPQKAAPKQRSVFPAAYIFTLLIFCQSFAWAVFHSTIANLDRYFLAPFAFSIPCVLITMKWLKVRASNLVTGALAIIIAVYSACAQYDYLAWNRIRWQALEALEKRGVSPGIVDGGTEYDYWNDPSLSNDLTLSAGTFRNIHKGGAATRFLRGWSINGEYYLISTREIPNYKVLQIHKYWSPLFFSDRTIYVLQAATPNQH